MYKKILFFALLSILSFSVVYGQEEKVLPATLTRNEAGVFFYDKVFDVTGAKDILYDRAKQWMIKNIKTGDGKAIFDDAGKNNITFDVAWLLVKTNRADNPVVEFKVTLSFKDNKYKIVATQFMYTDIGRISEFSSMRKKTFNHYNKKTEDALFGDFDTKFSSMLKSLQSAEENKDSNW
ncbi:MAG: DUF4468 domain-containing protein [Bacteroidota bacterium]